MAKVFVDTNCVIGLANRNSGIDPQFLDMHEGFISILSCHILFYVNKIRIPNLPINDFIETFNIVSLEEKILQYALIGPTDDLEDNIQLHSATKADADFFVTFDKKLLEMKFFGKTQIIIPEDLK
jgi:predicted nucleic acid-binding protein